MSNNETGKLKKRLHIYGLANAALWVLALVAQTILLQGTGNPKGLIVLLMAGAGVAVSMTASISKLK